MNADQDLLSALHRMRRDAAAAKAAIIAGADVNIKDLATGDCALLLAIEWGMKGAVKLLLDKGADVRVANEKGVTPVIAMADKLRDVALLKAVISRGADIAAFVQRPNPPINAWSALHIAVCKPKLEFAQALLAAGLGVDHRHHDEKVTPLAMLCRGATSWMSDTEMEHARWLLDRGADPMARDAGGLTPFHYAAGKSNAGFLRSLIAKGARLTDGDTPLFAALHTNFNNTDVWDLLFEMGAKLEERNARGVTPLLDAQSNWNEAAVRYLLGRGADVQAKDANGRTALERARVLKQEKIIGLLEEAARRRKDSH